MRGRSKAASKSDVVGPLVNGYQRLSADQIIADLPRLDRDELHLVQLLEGVSGSRDPVGDRIAELLAGLDAHEKSAKNARRGPAPADQPDPILVAMITRPLVVDIGPRGLWKRRARKWTRGFERLAAIVVVSAGAIVVVGRGATRVAILTAAESAAAPPAPAPASAPATTRAVRASGATGAVEDPLVHLLLAVPTGYTQQPDSASRSGPSDLAKAVSDDGTAGVGAILTRDGFVHGFQRVWLRDDQVQVAVMIYQFRDGGGADAYARDLVGRARSISGFNVTDFPVPGIAPAVGLTSAATGDVTAIIVFHKGPYLVRLTVNSINDSGLAATAQQLAHAQYARL
jgi:hypothetical protein